MSYLANFLSIGVILFLLGCSPTYLSQMLVLLVF